MTGVVLVNPLGRPEPSPEISRRLRAIHPNLHLSFVNNYFQGEQWAVCMKWNPEDRRWQDVQNGKIPSDQSYDIIGYLPMLCGVDEAPAYLERMLRTFPREDINHLVDSMSNWDTGVIQSAYQTALSEVLDRPDPTGKTKVRRTTRVI